KSVTSIAGQTKDYDDEYAWYISCSRTIRKQYHSGGLLGTSTEIAQSCFIWTDRSIFWFGCFLLCVCFADAEFSRFCPVRFEYLFPVGGNCRLFCVRYVSDESIGTTPSWHNAWIDWVAFGRFSSLAAVWNVVDDPGQFVSGKYCERLKLYG